MRNLPGILLMALLWMALTGSWTVANALLGVVLGAATSSFVREQRRSPVVRFRPLRIATLGLVFFYELAISGYRVAKLVLAPHMEVRPGILAYPLKVDRNFEITLLANLITLTPGTLSIDVSADRKTLFVHAIDCSDPGQTRRDIANSFERRILEAFR